MLFEIELNYLYYYAHERHLALALRGDYAAAKTIQSIAPLRAVGTQEASSRLTAATSKDKKIKVLLVQTVELGTRVCKELQRIAAGGGNSFSN